MFPSMKDNSYPLFYNHSPSFTLETNNISFQNHQEFYSNNYFMPSNNIPLISENPINTYLEAPIINLQSSFNNPSSNINKQVSSRRAIGKRDRHTKISTAQGVRDRRVRLSINIAREFFNLQDMLGFDKASKTLGWLLEKSKDAINELTSTTNKALFSSFDSNVVARNIEDNDVNDKDEQEDLSKNASIRNRRRKEHYTPDDDQSVVKAIIRRTRRAKARDRARERTKNKKTFLNQSNHTHLESANNHHQIDQQITDHDEQNYMMFHQLISGSSPTNLIPCGGINKGVSVREPVVIKSKSSRESSHNYNYDMIVKDYELGFDNYHNNCGIIQTPGLSALNIINLSTGSTEIHINAKPWDAYNSQDLH